MRRLCAISTLIVAAACARTPPPGRSSPASPAWAPRSSDSLAEIVEIRASSDLPARQARQIERRERDIANGRRMRATSFFNIAVSYLSLPRAADAREYANKVVDDEQFGDRAREVLTRLK